MQRLLISNWQTATQKVDSIIAENPNLSLDDLVQTRKINADQKAQAQKKPALQFQLAQLEEQLALHKKIEEDFAERLQSEGERLSKKHEKEVEELRSELAKKTADAAKSSTREKLLVLSRFLRAAAARRQTDDDGSEESKAFEGVLLLLYGGDSAAVDAAEKLIEGGDDAVPSTEGAPLQVNCKTHHLSVSQNVPNVYRSKSQITVPGVCTIRGRGGLGQRRGSGR